MDQPKKPGGRPRKHATSDAATQARKASDRRRYERSRQPHAPSDFIMYEPPLPCNIPVDTPPQTGLRISLNIQVPPEHDIQSYDTCEENLPPSAPVQEACPPTLQDDANDAETTQRIQQIQKYEQENSAEQEEYEARVAAQMTAADYEAAETLKALQVESEERQRSVGVSSQHSGYIQRFDDSDLSAQRNSSPALRTNNNLSNIQRSSQPLTPRNKDSPGSQPRSSGSKGKRSVPFPAQKNNLLGWMNPGVNTARVPSTSPPLPQLPQEQECLPVEIEDRATPITPTAPPRPPINDLTARAPQSSGHTPSPNTNNPQEERTAFKLAKQLRRFQGCTHEQHQQADRNHQKHHQRPDVHPKCSSMADITPLVRGSYNGGTPLPDVLSSPKLMKATDVRGVDYQAAFEGTSSQAGEDSETQNEGLPHNLCLSQHHASSKKNRLPKTTFDIDSTCCFPTSLGFARHGIHWLPKVHAYLNLKADIHFGLRVPGYTSNGKASLRYVPLHKVPHYCLGTLIGMSELQLFIFFPALHEESDYEHSTYLSSRDEQLWLDAILIPCITKVVDCSNILGQYPASARIANLDSLAMSAEGFARKESAREQLLKHAIQPQHLDPLWTLILETIEDNPGLHRFRGATLFSNAKNTKVEYNRKSLTQAYEVWEQRWSDATNPEFYNKDRTYVDLAKQVTSKDSAVPYDQIPEDHEAEVFLWKKCCLDAYSRTRAVLNVDGSKAKGNPTQTRYPWATMRDTMGLTLFAAPRGAETRDGLIYSQFYGSIKTPFDSSKVYVFDNDSVENLALDPGYVRSLQQEGGGITFSKGVCEFAYLSSKRRAHANLLDNRWRSYGVREEHRISLSMMEEIYEQWVQWDLYDADDVSGSSPPLPYYIVPTDELLSFLYAQINKYCFLFEHVLAHTARTYSLPETMVMVVALRALRFCYGSNLLVRESLLYKNRWEVRRGEKLVVKEGLGMRESMERCGLGWFLPKFNWNTWRLAPPHGDNILVGNLTMHEEYKRRWRAVKDLRDVYIRFNQAESWYEQYNMQGNQGLEKVWLEYLIALNLEQFDVDVQRAMLTASKRSNELRPDAAQSIEAMKFCHHDMRKMFMVDGEAVPPHMVTGNKMRFEKVMDVLFFLFMWDEQERPGWGNKPYRVILQKTFEMLERRLGYRRADNWLGEFLHVVRLTHWVLPYPSNGAFITSTKASHRQGLKRRMMWFSFVYANPAFMELPLRGPSSSISRVLWQAGRQTFNEERDEQVWGISQLVAAVRAQGVEESGEEEYWVTSTLRTGLKKLVALWERGQPPRLKMLEQIRKKTLDELDSIMAEFSQEWAGQDLGGGVGGGSDDDAEGYADLRRPAAIVARKNVMAAFAKGSSDSNYYQDDLRKREGSSATVSSYSVMAAFAKGSSDSKCSPDDLRKQDSSSAMVSSHSSFIPSESDRTG